MKSDLRFVKPNELYQCRLWTAFGDLANTYYRDEGRRVKVRLEKKSFSSMELNVRYCFKVRSFCHCGAFFMFSAKISMSFHVLQQFM